MADLTNLVASLRSHVRIGMNGIVETDPLKQYDDSVLGDVITNSIYAHNPTYTIYSIPDSEVHFVMWLSMIETYYMIASDTGWLYEITAQGAALNRQQIFDHFVKLASELQDKYDTAFARFLANTVQAQSTEVIVPTRYSLRNNRLILPPSITLSVVAQTQTTISLEWTRISDRQTTGYRLYKGSSEIIDEFSEQDDPLIPGSMSIYYTPYDSWKTKYRVSNLVPGSVNFFCMYVRDVYDHKCWSEISIAQPTEDGTINPVLTTNNSSINSSN